VSCKKSMPEVQGLSFASRLRFCFRVVIVLQKAGGYASANPRFLFFPKHVLKPIHLTHSLEILDRNPPYQLK
jgi:hypothetical protein